MLGLLTVAVLASDSRAEWAIVVGRALDEPTSHETWAIVSVGGDIVGSQRTTSVGFEDGYVTTRQELSLRGENGEPLSVAVLIEEDRAGNVRRLEQRIVGPGETRGQVIDVAAQQAIVTTDDGRRFLADWPRAQRGPAAQRERRRARLSGASAGERFTEVEFSPDLGRAVRTDFEVVEVDAEGVQLLVESDGLPTDSECRTWLDSTGAVMRRRVSHASGVQLVERCDEGRARAADPWAPRDGETLRRLEWNARMVRDESLSLALAVPEGFAWCDWEALGQGPLMLRARGNEGGRLDVHTRVASVGFQRADLPLVFGAEGVAGTARTAGGHPAVMHELPDGMGWALAVWLSPHLLTATTDRAGEPGRVALGQLADALSFSPD